MDTELIDIFNLPDLGPNQWHEFSHLGDTYRISLPPQFFTTRTEDRDYYERLLITRLDRGYIPEGASGGVLAGSYDWERFISRNITAVESSQTT